MGLIFVFAMVIGAVVACVIYGGSVLDAVAQLQQDMLALVWIIPVVMMVGFVLIKLLSGIGNATTKAISTELNQPIIDEGK